MHGKKSDTKFTIQFNRKNPEHLQVAEILNQQERGGKAQYIVDAVLHYIDCCGVRESLRPVRLDEKHIEAVVHRILQDRQGHGGDDFDDIPTPDVSMPTGTGEIDYFPLHNNSAGVRLSGRWIRFTLLSLMKGYPIPLPEGWIWLSTILSATQTPI
jgi:hypothetical protein